MSGTNQRSVVVHWLRAHWRARWLHGARLERWQERRAQRAVHNALRDAPFFRTHWAGHDLARPDTLPTVDKQTMMEHFDDYNTRGVKRDQAIEVALAAERSRDFRPVLDGLTVGLSSGTSGHRGLFVLSAAEQAAWAGTIVARVLHGIPRHVRVAFFLRSNSNLYEQTNSAVIRFRYYDLMTPLDEAIASLDQFQPTIVIAPPSMLAMLACAKRDGRLHIAPQRCISVAEVLEPQEREHIRDAFGVAVHQVYQATEGLLAISCAHGSLHVQEDIVRLQYEPLDTDAAPDEQRWTPIVTDLWRRTQPIVRYRLNDVLRLDDEPCACGSDWQVIRTIEGRRDDVCWFERRDGGTRPFFPDTLRRAILLASPAIADYALVQEPDGSLQVHTRLDAGADEATTLDAIRASITATVEQYACVVPPLAVDAALEPAAPDAKRRRIQRRHA